MATAGQSLIFPGRVIDTGNSPADFVRAIQHRLNQLGCGPVDEDGTFGAQTEEAVQLFQARSADQFGNPLAVDGRIGPTTWAALFAAVIPPTTQAGTSVQQKAVEVAVSQVGTMENPLGSNRGPEVDDYLRTVGLNPAAGSFPWCAAFVYFCFQKAATQLGVANPAIKDAGVLDCWNKAGAGPFHRIAASEASITPGLVKPGMVFVLKTGAATGHMGLIEKIEGNRLTTIEGNTNVHGAREGIGVFERVGRTISGVNLGFLDYA
jgi:Putative peptidoglycan binding domain/CHAP domain